MYQLQRKKMPNYFNFDLGTYKLKGKKCPIISILILVLKNLTERSNWMNLSGWLILEKTWNNYQWYQWQVFHYRTFQLVCGWWSLFHKVGNWPWKWCGYSHCSPHLLLSLQMWKLLAPDLEPPHLRRKMLFAQKKPIPIWNRCPFCIEVESLALIWFVGPYI